jgi:subtilisin-like proprotein convertase family protein
VGRKYYIQMVNHPSGSSLSIYDKDDGSLVVGPTVLSTLASNGACTNGNGDPVVLFDHLADRWLLSEFADPSLGNHLCVYISKTADPVTGGWFVYDFETPNFPDYPKYGVWPDAYYVTSNESGPSPVYALDRANMLTGAPAFFQRFTAPDLNGFQFQALIPADLDGAIPPPGGSPHYSMRHRDDEVHNPGSNNPTRDFLEIWEFQVDWINPGNTTFTGPINIPIAEIDSDLCGLVSLDCFPQPGTGETLDPLREVIMWRLQYRNFGTHQALVGNLVTDVDSTDHGGIRWFELRKAGGGVWSLFQEGTYAPDSDNRWMGSIAMDAAGNIALGYSVSGSSTFPSIRYTGREAADAPGTMPAGEFVILNGPGSSSVNRWGDYSSMNVDPDDQCTFWYTNQFAQSSGRWATQIARFKFDSCRGPAPQIVYESHQGDDFCASDASNENGVWEPGEVIDLFVEIRATGDFSNIQGTLASPTPGITIVEDTTTWPNLSGGSTAFSETPLQVKLAESIDCFSQVEFRIDVTATEGGPFTLSFSDPIGASLEPDIPKAIPDEDPGGVASTFAVTRDVTLGDVDVYVDIQHTWVGDVFIKLISPAGTEVVLLDRPGVPTSEYGCPDDNMDITFDDDAFADLETHCSDTNPWYSGAAAPVESLSAFNGESSRGTWSLIAIDAVAEDSGAIVDWELITTPAIEDQCTICETAEPCVCDLDNDGDCDGLDWLTFFADWGRDDCNEPEAEPCKCDLNGDGSCDGLDWLIFYPDWGRNDCPIPQVQ